MARTLPHPHTVLDNSNKEPLVICTSSWCRVKWQQHRDCLLLSHQLIWDDLSYSPIASHLLPGASNRLASSRWRQLGIDIEGSVCNPLRIQECQDCWPMSSYNSNGCLSSSQQNLLHGNGERRFLRINYWLQDCLIFTNFLEFEYCHRSIENLAFA